MSRHFADLFPDQHFPTEHFPGEEGAEVEAPAIPAFPDVPVRSFRIDLNENKSISESLFTRRRQVVSLGGGTADRWDGLITTPLLYPANVRTVMDFMVETGLYGQFTLAIPGYTGPASGEQNGSVQGGNQRGTSIIADGFTVSTRVLNEGEWFQIGNELKRTTANADSNSSGVVTFNFKPAIRVSPEDNDIVVIESPVMLAELTTIPGEETDSLKMMAFTISFQEALLGEST